MPESMTLAQLAAEWDCTLGKARKHIQAMRDGCLVKKRGDYYHLTVERDDLVQSTGVSKSTWFVTSPGWRWLRVADHYRGTRLVRPWGYRLVHRLELPSQAEPAVSGVETQQPAAGSPVPHAPAWED